MDIQAILNERWAQEKRLIDLGFDVDGGGTDMQTGEWDIFLYEEGKELATVLHGVADVDAFIATQAPV